MSTPQIATPEPPEVDLLSSLEPRNLWQRYHGVGVTILTIVTIALLEPRVPNPGSYYALVVAYTAASGGLIPALAAATLSMAAIMVDASLGGNLLNYNRTGIARLVGNFLALGGTAVVVGLLRQHNARLAAENARRIIEAKTREIEAAVAREEEAKLARITETLQRSLLLTPPSDEWSGLFFASFYEAAWTEAQVGGDFMDAFVLSNGQVAFVVGDVTGKGVVAAARTAEVKFVLRAFLRDDPSSAARAVARLNHFLCVASAFNQKEIATEYVCLSLVLVDPPTGESQVVIAGAESPLMVRDDGTVQPVVDVETGSGYGPMLGVDPDLPYTNMPICLGPQDALLMLTDGITEARRPSDRAFFGEVALYDRLREIVSTIPPNDDGNIALRALANTAKSFVGEQLHDDVCLMLIRRRSDSGISKS